MYVLVHVLHNTYCNEPTQGVESTSVTGRQLHEKITAMANLLKCKGISPNDRVILTIPVSVDFYAIAIAIFAVGGYMYTSCTITCSCTSKCNHVGHARQHTKSENV